MLNLPPYPFQVKGCDFLASHDAAFLCDDPGLGKSRQAIDAFDAIFGETANIITTVTGVTVWQDQMDKWLQSDLTVGTADRKRGVPNTDIVIASWEDAKHPGIREQLLARRVDALIPDEAHYAKNPAAFRTRVLYGDGDQIGYRKGLAGAAGAVWPLTGTPIPNSPIDIYAHLFALAPKRLRDGGRVMTYAEFQARYCIVKTVMTRGEPVEVIVGGQNIPELRERLDGFILRRRADTVLPEMPKIRFDILPLNLDDLRAEKPIAAGEAASALAGAELERAAIIAAAEEGKLNDETLGLAKLRRAVGAAKAHMVVRQAREDLEGGIDKLVLFAWHRDVIDILAAGLSSFGASVIDGRTKPQDRAEEVAQFQEGTRRVFIGQMQAAGEVITLTAANQMIVVEYPLLPKDLQQPALRIRRIGQQRPCFVRVASFAGTIDDKLARIIVRKVRTIRELLD